MKALTDKQLFELVNIAYGQHIDEINTMKNNVRINLFGYIKKFKNVDKDDTISLPQVKITDMVTNKKTYRLLNGELLEFVKESYQDANADQITLDNAKNDGLYIIKVNDDCYDIVQVEKVVNVVKGWVYNGKKEVVTKTKIATFKRIMVSH